MKKFGVNMFFIFVYDNALVEMNKMANGQGYPKRIRL